MAIIWIVVAKILGLMGQVSFFVPLYQRIVAHYRSERDIAVDKIRSGETEDAIRTLENLRFDTFGEMIRDCKLFCKGLWVQYIKESVRYMLIFGLIILAVLYMIWGIIAGSLSFMLYSSIGVAILYFGYKYIESHPKVRALVGAVNDMIRSYAKVVAVFVIKVAHKQEELDAESQKKGDPKR